MNKIINKFKKNKIMINYNNKLIKKKKKKIQN
jgi:hypothetical protein